MHGSYIDCVLPSQSPPPLDALSSPLSFHDLSLRPARSVASADRSSPALGGTSWKELGSFVLAGSPLLDSGAAGGWEPAGDAGGVRAPPSPALGPAATPLAALRHAREASTDGIPDSVTLALPASGPPPALAELRVASLHLVELCVLKALEAEVPGAPDTEVRALVNRVRACVAGAPDLALQLLPTLKRLLCMQPAAVAASLLRCDAPAQLARLLSWLHAHDSCGAAAGGAAAPPAAASALGAELAGVLTDVVAASSDAARGAMRSEEVTDAAFALLLSGWCGWREG